MMNERLKELIQLYIDGRLDGEQSEEVKRLIKSDAEAKSFYKGLVEVQKKVKKLEHKAAFAEFAERWPRRVRTEHEKIILRRRTIRVVSSLAAVTVVAFVGFGLLRAGLVTTKDAAEPMVAEESVMMAVAEDADVMAKNGSATEAPMMESAPAEMGDSTAAAGNAAETEEEMSDAAADERTADDWMPENAFVIESDEGNAEDFFEALLTLTEEQIEQPVIEENRVLLLLNEENIDIVLKFLNEKEIITDGMEIGMTLVIIFNE